MHTHSRSPYRVRRPFVRCLTVVAALAVAGCADDVPTSSLQPEDAALARVAGGPGAIASVRGGAHFDLQDPPGFVGDFKWMYRFSINATAWADGSSSGKLKAASHLPLGQNNAGVQLDWTFEVEVDCLEVEGNTAWITGFITKAQTDSPVGPGPGGYAMVIVQDSGNGQGDQINVGPAFVFGAEDCRDKPPISLDAAVDGNIRVAGGT